MAFVRLSEFFEEFRKISQILEATTAEQMKIEPYCQRQRWNPLNVLFNFVPYVDFSELPYISLLVGGLHTRAAVARLP